MAASTQTIRGWLQEIELDCYVASFESSGYFDLIQCISLTEDELDAIGVRPSGHRKRILAHLPDADILLGTVPSVPPKQRPQVVDYVNVEQDDEYVNVQELGIITPALPPKTVSPVRSELMRPKPAPRIRKSMARSRTGSDVMKESNLDLSSGEKSQRKKPVPQPRSKMSPGLMQEDSSADSSDSLADSKNSQDFEKKELKVAGSVLSSTNPERNTDSPDVELANPTEMAIFKIGMNDPIPSADTTEEDFLGRLAEIEKQINDDLLELDRQSSDDSDSDEVGNPKTAVSAAALSGEVEPKAHVAPSIQQEDSVSVTTSHTSNRDSNRWQDITSGGVDFFNLPVPLPPSSNKTGSAQGSYDVPKSTQGTFDNGMSVESHDISPPVVQPNYEVPAPPIPVKKDKQETYDVPNWTAPVYHGSNSPAPAGITEDQTYDVPVPVKEVNQDDTIYEPIWNITSQQNSDQGQTNSLPSDSSEKNMIFVPSQSSSMNTFLTPLKHDHPSGSFPNAGVDSFALNASEISRSHGDGEVSKNDMPGLLDVSPPVRNFEPSLPELPKLPPMPAELTEFDPLQDVDTTFMRSAKRLEDVGDDEEGEIYDCPPPSFAPPSLPPVPTRRPPPPVPPRNVDTLPETLGQKTGSVENEYVEGSFDQFSKSRAESNTSSIGSRSSVPPQPPPPVPLLVSPGLTPTRKAPPPPIGEEYHLLDHDPFTAPPVKPPMPFKVAPMTSPKVRLDSDDELGGFSTDDNMSLSDGGEFVDSCEDLLTINKMVGVPPGASKRIPITQASASQRTTERCGFLFKQDSNQRILASSWTKQWVVFNGEHLRYYEEKKSMVSKRIIPVAIMRNVENEIKQGDSKPNRFKLKTADRIYTFAADKMDDVFLWTNTLMEAIISFQNKCFDTPEGLWMNSPDREGFLKMEGMKGKVFVAIKGDKLCYYNTREDFRVGSPIHQIDMKLCAVKEIGKNKLQLPTNYKTFNFACESVAETHMWKKAMEDAIAEGLSDTKVVEQVYEEESNRFCADCDASDPSWASINLGIVMCKRCAGIHRQLHTPASKVRSLKLDTKVWTPTVIKLFHVIGNKVSNDFWNGANQGMNKISPESDDPARQQFIETKYQERQYCTFHPLKDNMEVLDEALCTAAQTEDVAETMRLIFSGANMTYISDRYDPPMTSLQLAKKEGKRLQAEFLYHNGAEVIEKESLGRRNSDNYRRRIVTHKGYLYKTGANQKDFLRRWCVLEHCTLSYYAEEKSMTAKDSIESKDMISLCITKVDKQDFSFELNTTKFGGRIYLFAAESAEARQEWMKRIAQSFSPSDAISLINDFTRGGYVFLQDGAAASWVQCWFQIRGKELAFFNEREQQFDGVDLRKLIGFKRFDENGCAECFEKGFHFVLDFPKRAWYIQADSVAETEAWFSTIQKLSKESGNSLAEQQLTSESVPIVVDKCLAFVAANGMEIQGIYRLNGTHSKINKLLQEFHDDARSVHLKAEDHEVHDVANCLKRFFRTLDDPLLTNALHHDWTTAAALADHESKLQYYHFYLKKLPAVNYVTLRKVIMHLHSVAEHESVNKMSVKNLASIFGPALMVVDQDESVGYRSTNHEIGCFVDLIYYHKWLFDIQDTERHIEEKIQEAQEKIKRAATVKGHGGHIMIPIYVGKKSDDRSFNQKIPEKMTAQEVVDLVVKAANLPSRNWALFEVVCGNELERVIHYNEKVLPVLLNWSNWDSEYSTTCYLCIRENNLYEKLDMVLDPTLSLFSELKLREKKSFKKYYFEFKQAKLAYYKSAQASNPQGSWNVEDLLIYIGAENKRSAPTNWNITFVKANERVARTKETPYFGRTMSCLAADEMYRWLASMTSAQHPEGLFPPRPPPLSHSVSQPATSTAQAAAPHMRGPRVLPDLSEIKKKKKF